MTMSLKSLLVGEPGDPDGGWHPGPGDSGGAMIPTITIQRDVAPYVAITISIPDLRVNRSIQIIRNSQTTMIQTNMAMTLPPKGHNNKPVDNEQRAEEEKKREEKLLDNPSGRSPVTGARGRRWT